MTVTWYSYFLVEWKKIVLHKYIYIIYIFTECVFTSFSIKGSTRIPSCGAMFSCVCVQLKLALSVCARYIYMYFTDRSKSEDSPSPVPEWGLIRFFLYHTCPLHSNNGCGKNGP